MAEPILEIKNLVKCFKEFEAVKGVSLAIPKGHCFGLLGPNGAGKTTTIEIMEGIQEPSSGEVLYKGQSLGRQFRNEAGIMFQATALQEFITVRETLKMFERLYSRTVPLETLIESCSMGEFVDSKTNQLSGGQRQRLLLALGLINDPDIIFLDEPTTGLDPQARHQLWALVKQIKSQGKTVLLTTHYMDEAYELCDQIAIMDHGKIIALGTPDELLAKHFSDVVVRIPIKDFIVDETQLTEPIVKDDYFVNILSSDVNHTIQDLLTKQVNLEKLQIRARTLDDLFLELTGHDLRG